jgi:hypothetical protein
LNLRNLSLDVYSSRLGKFRRLKGRVMIKEIIPNSNIDPCKGGIEDVGNFSEGFCFMIKFIRLSRHFIWELCTDSFKQKSKWMKGLTRINKFVNTNKPKPLQLPKPLPKLQLIVKKKIMLLAIMHLNIVQF